MFLAPADTPGITVGRHIGTLDKAMIGGHCEVFFENVFVPDENVLGAVDEGFAYAQVRLGPARMTHVMRWLEPRDGRTTSPSPRWPSAKGSAASSAISA